MVIVYMLTAFIQTKIKNFDIYNHVLINGHILLMFTNHTSCIQSWSSFKCIYVCADSIYICEYGINGIGQWSGQRWAVLDLAFF